MKKILLLAGTILIVASCTWDMPLENEVPCVSDEIHLIKSQGFNASVWQYQVNGSAVYYIDYTQQCCDFSSTLYDTDCNVICSFGGWGGIPCADSVWDNLTDGKCLYSP